MKADDVERSLGEANHRGRASRYHALARVGRGGMADVHLAVARSGVGFSKLLVLKTLREELAKDEDMVAMFLDEARLAARLDHPNIVQVYELGAEGDALYIAMEHLDGQPLDRLLARVSEHALLDPRLALHVAHETLSALAHAHALRDYEGRPLGVVHRDVSPQNLFVTYAGLVKLVDFGIAKGADTAVETRIGTFKGKVAYMAPEQARGEPVDRRADVFSVGVVLAELLTGKRFWGELSEPHVAAHLVADDVPKVRTRAPGLDTSLARIVDRATSARREARYESAAAMQADIEAALSALGGQGLARELSALVSREFATERLELDGLVMNALMRLERGESVSPRALAVSATFGTPTHESDVAHTRVSLARNETLVETVPTGRVVVSRTKSPHEWPRFAAFAVLGVATMAVAALSYAREEPPEVERAGGAPFVAAPRATGCAREGAPVVGLRGDIDEDATLTCDHVYRLEHLVFVREGVTLTIERGTRIVGDAESNGTLVVEAGGRLVAEGTAEAPIVFGSERPHGSRAPGDWGGVIVLGRAPTNLRTREGEKRRGKVEGILERGAYGGDDPEDDSGVFRYVRIEHGGSRLGPNNEINGLTLAGVGRGTRVDHVQVARTKDDCFEFFGGTVDAHHLVCDAPGDDAFDWDEGYTGRLQFLLYRDDASGDGNNGLEGDNDAAGSTNTPVSAPHIANVTLCGGGGAKESYAMLLRRGTGGTVVNVVATGFKAFVDVRDRFASPRVRVEGFAVFGSALPLALLEGESATLATDDDHGFDELAWLSAYANERIEPTHCTEATAGGEAAALPEDGFFDTSARYLGAFRDATDTWHEASWLARFP